MIQTRVEVPPPEERDTILRHLAPELAQLLGDIKANVGDLPTDIAAGAVLGHLRARGFSWVEAFTVMHAYAMARQRPSIRHAFHIEMITCSVGCADYLPLCLERNMRHFDHTIVVTSPEDEASQAVAEKAGASVLVTDRFYRGGNRFNRGDAYNRALQMVRHHDWVTFVDVDIVLEHDHRARLEAHGLQDDVFYGCDRLNVLGDEERRRFIAGEPCEPRLQSTSEWGFGYYQLFNLRSPFLKAVSSRGEALYPSAPDVGYSDYVFRTRFGSGHQQGNDGIWSWDPIHQRKLPWACYHLGADGEGLPSRTIHY